MKYKYTITLDKETFEEFKKYVSNVSGFLNATITKYVNYKKRADKIFAKEQLEQKDIDELKEVIDIINVPWANS